MTFIPGGGSGSISGSTDVALNNPAGGEILTYDAGIAKWKNASSAISGEAWTITPTKTAAYSAVNGEAVLVDTTASPFMVTLPAAVANERIRVINVATSSANLCTIVSNSILLGDNPVDIYPGGSIDFWSPTNGIWGRF